MSVSREDVELAKILVGFLHPGCGPSRGWCSWRLRRGSSGRALEGATRAISCTRE
jgi:hypothetical protein